MKNQNWTRDELILAINLYCKMEFGKIHARNADVIELAELIGRTPGAVSLKLGNFGSFDPTLKARGVGGLSNSGKLDKIIWNEFYENWEERAFESEKLRARYEKKNIERLVDIRDLEGVRGKEREAIVKARVNQYLFRTTVLASYNGACCLTGIKHSGLLVASHISPWAKDKDNRMNPSNGLCLNVLHDKAFDNFLFTITPEHKIKLSKNIIKEKKNKFISENFIQYEGKEISMPRKFLPDEKFLLLHNTEFDKRSA